LGMLFISFGISPKIKLRSEPAEFIEPLLGHNMGYIFKSDNPYALSS
jgi:hypothetical protein